MSTNANADDQVRRFYAYDTGSSAGMHIYAAPRKREWMDGTDAAYAYRCLPLLMANQAGWIITGRRTAVSLCTALHSPNIARV